MKPRSTSLVPWNLAWIELRALARRPEWWGLTAALLTLLALSAVWPIPFRQPVLTQFEFLTLTLQSTVLWFGLLVVLQPPLYRPPCGAPRHRIELVLSRLFALTILGWALVAMVALVGVLLTVASQAETDQGESQRLLQNLPRASLILLIHSLSSVAVLTAWADFLRRRLPSAPAVLLLVLPFFLPTIQPLGTWQALAPLAGLIPSPSLPQSATALLENSPRWLASWRESLHPIAQTALLVTLSAALPDRRLSALSN